VKVFFFGLGYCAKALIRRTASIEPIGTVRNEAHVAALRDRGIEAYAFDGARADPGVDEAIRRAEAIVISIPPGDGAGPLDRFGDAIAAAPALRRIVCYSTVGVYGDHGGAWVDERSATLTRTERGLARLADEARWMEAGRVRGASLMRPAGAGHLLPEAGEGIDVDILRLPGIYGPGRNALIKLAASEARRIVKPGHVVNRAHVDDIAEVTRLALERSLMGQIWNVADDEPAPPQDVIAYAASLLGVAPPPEAPFDPATMPPLAASFYLDNRRVSNRKIKMQLGFSPGYPTYREGLRALFEAGEGRAVRETYGQTAPAE
jgi:nucleoside-diphosphate-sugar epimerase